MKLAKATKNLSSAQEYAARYIEEHGVAQFIEEHTEWPIGSGKELVESYSVDRATGEFNKLGAFEHEGTTILIYIVARNPYEISEREYEGWDDDNDDEEKDESEDDGLIDDSRFEVTVELHRPVIELDVVDWDIKYGRTGRAPKQTS